MAEKYEHNYMVDPPRSHDKVPNKKIVKLGIKITDVLDHKLKGLKVDDAEYYGLAEIVTDEMADLALKMKVRHHYTFADLKKPCPSRMISRHPEARTAPPFARYALIAANMSSCLR